MNFCLTLREKSESITRGEQIVVQELVRKVKIIGTIVEIYQNWELTQSQPSIRVCVLLIEFISNLILKG